MLWRRAGLPAPDAREIDAGDRSPARDCCISTVTIRPRSHAAAAIARQHGIPVTMDVDTHLSRASTKCCRTSITWWPVRSSRSQWTNERDPFKALELIQQGIRDAGGGDDTGRARSAGAIDGGFVYSPAFVVNCVDTTGAGDVFHGAFCYAVLQGMSHADTLEFSNAMAALNCTAIGARGGIGSIEQARALIGRAERRSNRDYAVGSPRMIPLRSTERSSLHRVCRNQSDRCEHTHLLL